MRIGEQAKQQVADSKYGRPGTSADRLILDLRKIRFRKSEPSPMTQILRPSTSGHLLTGCGRLLTTCNRPIRPGPNRCHFPTVGTPLVCFLFCVFAALREIFLSSHYSGSMKSRMMAPRSPQPAMNCLRVRRVGPNESNVSAERPSSV